MAIQHARTVTGIRPPTGVTDADFDACKCIQIDTSRNFGDKDEYPYELSVAPDGGKRIWGVLGNKCSYINGVRDTLIIGGIVPIRINVPFDMATMQNKGILATAAPGIAMPAISGITPAIVAEGDTINSLSYTGAGATAPAPENADEVFLVTASNEASKFQTSTGTAAYADATVGEALGATGKFLGDITGAETGSDSVVSDETAKAYFDADSSRYVATNTYYLFDGTNLKTVVYLAAPTNGGKGKIVNGGTLKFYHPITRATLTVDVAYVDLDHK